MVAGDALRIVFFGTPDFAVPTLQALLDSRHPVVAVVTQPDRPRGRGQKITEAPVKALAVSAGVPVLQPERLKDAAFLPALAALGADLGVVAAYGKILTDAVLAVPPRGLINVHASLLPRYRGAAPIHRAIIDGERETGVTIMRIVKALDAGAMLATARRRIGDDETSVEVERDLAALGANLLVATIDALAGADMGAVGSVKETPQDDTQATYAHRLTRDEGLIDWTQPAARIHNLVRGLQPWPHAFTFLDGHRLIVLATHPSTDDLHAPPGTIVEATGDHLRTAAGSGSVDILRIQPEGKRPMPVREFLAGHRVSAGQRFQSQP